MRFCLPGTFVLMPMNQESTLGKEHTSGCLVDVLRPRVLCLYCRHNPFVAVVSHVPNQIRHPIHVLFNASRNVTERGGIVRADQGQEVRESCDLKSQIGSGTIRPLVLQPLPADTANIDPIKGAGDGIKPCGVDDNVERIIGRARLDACRRYPFDGCLADIDRASRCPDCTLRSS